MQWIPVNKWTPEENGTYLIATPGGYVGALYFRMDGGWAEGMGGRPDDYWNENVTHWMPLPAPPAD